MRQEFLARLRGKQALLGQLLAVFMLLQPVAAAIGADLAARDPLARAILASFCSPSGASGPVTGMAGAHACCLPGGICAVGACSTATPVVAGFVAERDSLREYPIAHDVVALDARSFHWPQSTGPPAA